MRRVHFALLSAAFTGLVLAASVPSHAIPVFARKYGFNCTMCHSSFPRLNDYGYRYRENSYQLPGRENEERTVLESPTPLAFRTSAGYNYDKFENTEGDKLSKFQVNGLDILSGGLFKENIGYIAVYLPEISGSSGVAPQTGSFEAANVVFSHLGSSWANLRAGRFEPDCIPFSTKRQLSVSPYEIYDYSFPAGPTMADTQSGLEMFGYDRSGFKYAAGWVNGSDTNNSGDSPADFYLRGAKVFGEGEGQTAGHRVGVSCYFGKARPVGLLPATDRKSFDRIGLDASLNFKQWNLGLQYLSGKDNKALWGTASDVEFKGGFAELLYMPAFDWAGFLRYDTVNPDDVTGTRDISRWTIGSRYYLYDNIALHLEYSSRKERMIDAPDATEKFFTTRLDFAF